MCEYGERGSVGNAEFPKNMVQVDLHCPLGQPKPSPDFLVCYSLGEHEHDLAFAGRKGLVRALYGYRRNTNPRLNAIRSELEVALDACSSRGMTIPQLKEMLTFATRDDARPLFTSPSLLQLMKAAEFKIFWLSNQQMVGSFDNWSAVFSKPADVRIFTDRRGDFERRQSR